MVKLNFGSGEVLEHLSGPGKYQLSVLVADRRWSSPVQWTVAELDLDIPAPQSAYVRATKSQKAELDAEFRAQPILFHTFQPEPSRPSSFFALLISAAMMLPLLWLLQTTSPWIKSFSLPRGGESVWALAFLLSLCGMIAIYLLYWTSLNIFQIAPYVSLGGALSLFFGHGALSRHHRRVSSTAAKSE